MGGLLLLNVILRFIALLYKEIGIFDKEQAIQAQSNFNYIYKCNLLPENDSKCGAYADREKIVAENSV